MMNKYTESILNRINLQLFADDEADDTTDEADSSAEETESEKKYTDADVDRIVQQKLAKERKAQARKAQEAAEAEKLKNMTAQEKHDAEFNQMKAELAELKAQKLNADMTATASDILKESGINVSSKLVAKLIADTAEDTKANVDEFVKLFNDAVSKGVKAAMKSGGSTPKKTGGEDGWTKEKIMAVKSPTERQKLIKEHMNLFR